MTPIISAIFSGLRLAWRQILALHLIFSGLGIIVFAPLLGILGQALLKLSGEPALADMDLLFFALSPAGFVALLLFVSVAIVISAFELTSMLVIGMGSARGKTLDVFSALVFSLSRAGKIFHFAARLVFKLLLIVVPFLLAGAAIAYALISDYDINYYLSVQPPVFWGSRRRHWNPAGSNVGAAGAATAQMVTGFAAGIVCGHCAGTSVRGQ